MDLMAMKNNDDLKDVLLCIFLYFRSMPCLFKKIAVQFII